MIPLCPVTPVPVMETWLKVVVLEPEIVVVPSKFIVPELCVNVALFAKFPETKRVPDGAVRVPPESVRLLNEHVPVTVVVVD